MIAERIGDLLDQPDLNYIAHQANLFHTFGAGIARQIARRFPYAVAADLHTPIGDRRKPGTYSVGISGDARPNVVNLYTQDGFGPGSTDLAAMRAALTMLEKFVEPSAPVTRLGIPHGLGCGLAGGSWPKVYGIIKAVFAPSPVTVAICRLPTDIA